MKNEEEKNVRRVVRFINLDKKATAKLNDWLEDNPGVTLLDIRPVIEGGSTEIIYAMVDIPDRTKKEEEENE